MPAEDVLCLGYVCSACGARVAVFRSNDTCTEDALPVRLLSTCVCGERRFILRSEIGRLEFWREEISESRMRRNEL